MPLRLRDFISGTLASADLYVLLESDRYVKILEKGQVFEPDRVRRYQENEVEIIYIKSEDVGPYVHNITQLSEKLVSKPNIDPQTAARFINRVADTVLSELLFTNMHKEALLAARQVTSQMIVNMQSKPNFATVFKTLEELGPYFSRHAIGVGMISTAFALKMRWGSERNLQILQCGGMLHDVGFREMPPELAEKKRAEMSVDEIKLYETHPTRGALLLESVSFDMPEVIQIVNEHHELPSGRGFPRGLKSDRIFPLARMNSLADLCCHQLLVSKTSPKPRTAQEVAIYLESIHSHDFPPHFWDALHLLFGSKSVKNKKAK